MTFSDRNYLKWLFGILGGIFAAALFYAAFFVQNYPLPVTNRISFDAKLKFIKEGVAKDKIDTLIVGSSIGLNNVRGSILETNTSRCHAVLNLSVFEASALEVEQVLALRKLFPNLRQIIYSAQFPDFAVASRFADYHPDLIEAYLDDHFTPWKRATFLFQMCQNIFFCIKRQWNYLHQHSKKNQFGYLGFDKTGSIPLHIYGDDIIRSRWEQPHWTKQSPQNYQALSRIAQQCRREGIQFYFVIQPYRSALIERYPDIRTALELFDQKTTQIVTTEGGEMIPLYRTLPLDDSHFADRSHLNDKGSSATTHAIATFLNTQTEP